MTKYFQFFSRLYARVIHWSSHPHAPYYLAGLSFAEASFFPIPPDVMLAPMSLAKPRQAWQYATLTTVASALGGLFGYLLGFMFIQMLMPLIGHLGYSSSYHQVESWFTAWGFWALLVAGFTPIPYKLFTIAAGASHMPLLPFILASCLGRGGRFFLVSGLMRYGKKPMEQFIFRYLDVVGWGMLFILLVGWIVWRFLN